MVYKKKRTTKKKTVKRRVSSSKPIGFVKAEKGYKLVFGSKSRPRLGKNNFKKKSDLMKKARSLLKK